MSDEFIVLVQHQGAVRYFSATEPDVWVLDNAAYAQAFIDAGYDLPPVTDEDPRQACSVLSPANVGAFLGRVAQDEQSPGDLSELLTACMPTDSLRGECRMLPQLYYDFDAMELYSSHEQHIFEKYIPAGWKILTEPPWATVPTDRQYWVVAGDNLMTRDWET